MEIKCYDAGMLTLVTLLAALAPSSELTLDRIFSDPPLEGKTPAQLALSPGGKYVTFLRGSDKDSDVLDLWGAKLPDGKPELLVSSDDLLGGKTQKLTEQERMALERKRISKRGITGYLWCGDSAVLFPFSGDLYFVELGGGRAPALQPSGKKVVRLTHDDDKPELNPVCSKSGKKVAFVKDDAVVVMDTASKAQKIVTPKGSAVHHWGLPEFIAEEEMDRHEGMWWSPDEKSLLVFEVDERPVGVKTRAQIFADHTEMFEQRYPAAGEKNAIVNAWLVDVNGGKRALATPKEDGYLARGGFFPDGAPWLQWQSRDQKTLRFLDCAGGVAREFYVEKDDAWVELTDDFIPLKDGKRALWSTEQSGRRQIVVIDRKTGATTALTSEPEPVNAVEAVDDDKGAVFYTAWRDRGRQLQLFSVSLAGGPPTPLTPEPGWHAVKLDDAGHFFVDRASDFGKPATTIIKDAAGKTVLVLDDNAATELMSFDRPTPVWLDLKAADGVTTLNGLLLPPTSAWKMTAGKKYPVIVSVYGGPTAQTVTRAWGRGYALQSYWTERGYGVFLVDNRGMAGRDRAFTRAHNRAFGDIEVKDLFAAVEQLKQQTPWVDGKKLGVFGWSYGGFLSARAILDDDTPFAAAVAVAPVTDWALYDTHYTERYLGMSGKSYDDANLVKRAKLLNKPLLIVHGTADDNVLFEHSLRLIEALEKEGKMFQTMIYPGKAHGISGKPYQLHVYKTVTTFFDANLR